MSIGGVKSNKILVMGYLDPESDVRDREVDGAFSTVAVSDGAHVIWSDIEGCGDEPR